VSALQNLFPDNYLARAAARDSIAPVPAGDIAMKTLDHRTMVHLDVVLKTLAGRCRMAAITPPEKRSLKSCCPAPEKAI